VASRQSWGPWRGLSLDMRSVARALRRSPGYVAVAILSLTVGIGANTAVFSLVRQLLLEPLPVDRPNELRLVYWAENGNGRSSISYLNSSGYRDPSGGDYRSNFSYGELVAMQHVMPGGDLCGFNLFSRGIVSVDGRTPVVGAGMLVSGNCFRTVRPPMAFGRPLVEADDRPDAPAVVVLGYGFWTRVFDADRTAIGRTFRLNDVPVTIVGVTAAPYRGLSQAGFDPETDVTLTLAQQPQIVPKWAQFIGGGQSLLTQSNVYWVRVIARVRDGADASIASALQMMLRSTMSSGGLTPAQAARVTLRLLGGARGLDSLRTSTTQPLHILTAVVGVVMLIACVNVAGLMLARGVARQRELAVRRALGAGRGRLIRELLLESAGLSAAGGMCGVCLALWAAPALASMLTSGLGTNGVSVALDWPMLAAAAAFACAAGVVAGLLPALRFSRSDATMLNERASGTGAPKLLAGRLLLALQIAVSLPLVTGAGLFLRTLHNLGTVQLGFNPHGLVLFSVDPTMGGTSPDRTASDFPRLLENLQAIPGVTSATLLEDVLISGRESDSGVTIGDRRGDMYVNRIGPLYFETMGVPLVRGRAVRNGDRVDAPTVAVINETAARLYFGAGSPIGRHFMIGPRDVEVVGVAGDSKYEGLRAAIQPTALLSYLQWAPVEMHVAVRAEVDPLALRRAIEQSLAAIDPRLPIAGFKTQNQQIEETIGRERVFTQILTVFGAFALVLACIGLHGVTSYSVARRTSEIGIRLALGAQRNQVVWLVLRQVVTLAIGGLAVGLPLAWLAEPAVRTFLFGLEPTDPATIAISAVVILAVTIAAGFVPARRAGRMAALAALRSE
jgi:predicted permease